MPKWHSCQNSKAPRLTMIAWEQTKSMKKWPLTNALYCSLRAWNMTQNVIFKMYLCCLCIDFSVSQSIDKSMRCVYGTYCMSLRSFYTPQGRITVQLSKVKIICFRRLCVRYIAPWDSGNSATMSFRNLHVYHGDSYGSHRISIYTAHRRSIYIYIYKGFAPCRRPLVNRQLLTG